MENLLTSATAKNNFRVEAISGISVAFRTQKAEGCNLKASNLLKRNSIPEISMENFLKFSKHQSNLVWSWNSVPLQPMNGEPATQLNGSFLKVLD